MANFYKALQGRHNTAISFFAVVGTAFQYMHRLDATFISFVTLMMSFVLGHSIKDDYFKNTNPDGSTNTGVSIGGKQNGGPH